MGLVSGFSSGLISSISGFNHWVASDCRFSGLIDVFAVARIYMYGSLDL